MGVEQNDFRDMFSVYLSGPPQTQHMFCVSPAAGHALRVWQANG